MQERIQSKTMSEPIWLSTPHLSGEEIQLAEEALSTNNLSSHGSFLPEFEQQLSQLAARPVVALNSGTSAIHLALVALGVGTGAKVLCSDFTFAATAFPIRYQGAEPVFIGCEADTWNMDPQLLEEAINDCMHQGDKPAAIVMAHIYGVPAKIKQIQAIATKYDIPLVEDAAEAMGATVNSKQIGPFGHFGIWSFNGNKIISTGGGGALICQSEQEAQYIRKIAAQAKEPGPWYQHEELGYNYRMNNLTAGIGLAQLKVLQKYIDRRRTIFDMYRTELKGFPIQCVEEAEGCFANRWLTCISPKGVTDNMPEALTVTTTLQKEKIEARLLWKPMSLQPYFKGMSVYDNGLSTELFRYGVSLPSGSHLTNQQIHKVIGAIKKLYKA